MTSQEYIETIERILGRKLSRAEVGYAQDCFYAGWSVDRVVTALNQ